MDPGTDIIDTKTAGTIAGLFRERVRRTPQEPAYQYYCEKDLRFKPITWQEMSHLAGRWQAGIEREGLKPGDRVAVILRNCPEWVLFDLASLGLGLVTVPVFADDRPVNIHYILKATAARMVLIQDRSQWLRIERAGEELPAVQKIVCLQPYAHGEYAETRSEKYTGVAAGWLPGNGTEFIDTSREPSDLATIVYTSGTTGMPKGVMLSHTNLLENAAACLQRIPICSEDIFLSFLPLSHAFERTAGYYIPMMAGACVAYVRSIDKLAEDLPEVRPTILISVPRIYERIYTKIESGLEKKSFFSRGLFRLTVRTGWKRFLCAQGRLGWRPLLLLWPLLKRVVAGRLMDIFGGRMRLSISGGAPIAPSVCRVFIGLGVNFLQGYGLTETSPVISVNATTDNDPATVGRPLPGVECRLAPDGELLVRGDSVMLGYWQDREATDAVFDSDGYFHTGDVAEMDDEGRLKIVGRIKEILVLSTGKKIPPGDLELAVTTSPLFEQAMVVGEGRPFLAALVVLDPTEWEKLADRKGFPSDREDIFTDQRVELILLAEIARMTKSFPRYAQIRRIHASLTPWERQDGLITNTLKLRRKKIMERFRSEVDSLYKGH